MPNEDAALEYTKKSPFPMVSDTVTIEVRQLYEAGKDFFEMASAGSIEMASGAASVQELCQQEREV